MEEKDLIKLHRERAIATTFVFIGFILIAMVFFVTFSNSQFGDLENTGGARAGGLEVVAALSQLQ